MQRRLARIAAWLCRPPMKLTHTLSFLLLSSQEVTARNMFWHDHLHGLKLSICQGHRIVGQLHFAHLLLFPWLTKTAWNFLLGRGHRICCLVGTSLFLFFVYTVGVQSNHVDLVIIRIHVKTLMLVCGLLVVLLDRGKEIDVIVFSLCCWSQLLHKHRYPYFQCAIPCPCHRGKNSPTWGGQYSMLLPHSKNCC